MSTSRNKRQKIEHVSSISLGYLHSRKGSRKPKHLKRMRVLFDSGCGDTIVNLELIKDLEQQQTKKSKWSTKGGFFKTNKVCNITFMLPLFHKDKDITWKAHVDERNPTGCRYDLIVGRDLMAELGMDQKFSEGTMVWDDAEVPYHSSLSS